MSFPFFPLLSPWKAGLTPSLLPSCFMEGDWLVEAWFLRQHAKQWSVTEYSPHHWSLMSSVSLSRLLNLFISKETSQKRLLKRGKRGKERERTTHNTLSSTSHVSYLIGHRTMKHGKGEKEEREGKRRRGGEKRGRKGDFKANRPLLFSGGCEGRACAPEHVIAIWRRLVVLKAEAKPRLSTRLDRQSQIAISDADTKWKSAGSSIYPPNRRAIARFLIELFAFEINWVLLRSAVEWCIVGGRWVEVMMSCHAKCSFRRIGRE